MHTTLKHIKYTKYHIKHTKSHSQLYFLIFLKEKQKYYKMAFKLQLTHSTWAQNENILYTNILYQLYLNFI